MALRHDIREEDAEAPNFDRRAEPLQEEAGTLEGLGFSEVTVSTGVPRNVDLSV